jgi:hypothetical protein
MLDYGTWFLPAGLTSLANIASGDDMTQLRRVLHGILGSFFSKVAAIVGKADWE